MSDKIYLNKEESDVDYVPTDSDDELSEEERELLTNVRKGRQRDDDDDDGTNELMAFDDSDVEDEDIHGRKYEDQNNIEDLMQDSDIEDADVDDNDGDLPDTKYWGKKTSTYYHTDFVDPDHSGYTVEQEELAKAEEEEAKKIQLRIAKQLTEADYGWDIDVDATETNAKTKSAIVLMDSTNDAAKLNLEVKTDFTNLNKQQRLELFVQDSPEFKQLTDNFRNYLNEIDTLLRPIINYMYKDKMPIISAIKFAQTYEQILITYCLHVALYLLFKAKRIAVVQHPILERLFQLKKLLEELQHKYEHIIKPQLEALLKRIGDGEKIEFKLQQRRPATKQKLKILKGYEQQQQQQEELTGVAAINDDLHDDGENIDDAHEKTVDNGDDRRSISYQIAKNKGLMPHRKKEQRNPRVKHRGKYRKALVRRKGAVRTVRKETQRYRGELSGIKTTVSKSIKFKT